MISKFAVTNERKCGWYLRGFLKPEASPFFVQPEMGSVRFRVQTMGRRPLPSAARVRPGAHSARHQDSRNDLMPCRMAWHFVSDGAHAPHSDQTLGPYAPSLLSMFHTLFEIRQTIRSRVIIY